MLKLLLVILCGITFLLVACEEAPEECLKDIDCSSDRSDWRINAEFACQPLIEDRALYGVNWTDGVGESPFKQVKVMAPDYKTVEYMGNEIEFQNSLGVWQRAYYSCVYDPVNDYVVSIDVW